MTVSTQSLSEVLDHLRHGVFDKSVVDFLERHKGIDLVSELRLTYPITFQERRIGDKWEVALAKRVGTEMATRNIQNSLFVSLALFPVYIDCVSINIEGDFANGISRFGRLRVRPSVRKPSELRIATSRGFSVDRSPDGWAIEPLEKRTVRLSEAFLRGRGWQFHHLGRFVTSH